MQWSGPRWGSVSASLTALTSLWVGSLVALGTDEFLVEWQAGDAIMTTQWQGEGGRYMMRGSLPDTERYVSYLGQRGKTEFGLFASMICSQSLTNTGCFPKVSKICCLSKTLCSSVPSQLEGVRRILCWKQYLWKAGRWGALGWRTFVSFTPEIHDDTSWNLHLLARGRWQIRLTWKKVPSHIAACKENHKLRHVFSCF